MVARSILLLFVLTAVGIPSSSEAKRLKDRMYVPIDTNGFCFRRTNGTHQFGCTTDINGNVGVIHVVSEPADLDWVLEKGPHAPYIATLTPKTFTKDVMGKIKNSDKFSGVFLLNDDDTQIPDAPYSDDSSCPNRESSLYKEDGEKNCPESSPWNPGATDFSLSNFDFPIFLTKSKNTSKFLQECFDEFNKPTDTGEARDWPLCAMELKSHMYAAGSTETCIRRSSLLSSLNPVKFCDELGDLNSFGFLSAKNASKDEYKNNSVIMVTTRLDTINLFDNNEVGADTPVTSIVTLLETARLLAQADLSFDNGKIENIMFGFFFGEAFDYIGSSRTAYDMKKGVFPEEIDDEKFPGGQKPLLKPETVEEIIEIGQLFNKKSNGRLFAHTDTTFDDDSIVNRLVKYAGDNQISLQSSTGSQSRGLPPSSLHSFLKERREIPGVFISDFDSSYSNDFYHSIYDNAANSLGYNYTDGIDQEIVIHIQRTATFLSEYLFERATSRSARLPTFDANSTLINELLRCYLDTPDCDLFMAASNSNLPPFVTSFPLDPFQQYVGVDVKTQYHGMFTRQLLALFTGEILDGVSEEECTEVKDENKQSVYQQVFMKTENENPNWDDSERNCSFSGACGYCFRTNTFYHEAKSPAFEIEDYDFKSGEYSAWAESVWKTISARAFLKGSPSTEKFHFSVGVIVLILSFALVYLAERSASEVFGAPQRSGSESAATVSTNANAPMIGNEPVAL